jgi:hypothetical protein
MILLDFNISGRHIHVSTEIFGLFLSEIDHFLGEISNENIII